MATDDDPAGVSSAPAPDRPGDYETARAELAAIVTRLESGGQTLEESLALWQRAEQLADDCQRWLDGARAALDAAHGDDAT